MAIAFARALPWDAHAHEVGLAGPGARRGAAAERRAAGLSGTARSLCRRDSSGTLKHGSRRRWRRRTEAGDASVETAVLAALGRRAVLVAAPDAAELCDAAVSSARGAGDPILVADALLTQAGACRRTQDWEHAGAIAARRSSLPRGGRPVRRRVGAAEQGWYAMVHGRLEESEEHLERGP